MYPQQAPAFEARNQFGGSISDSTVDSPPTFVAPDFAALCEIKKTVVNNLPAMCCHCGAEYPPGSIIERQDGDIMAYCKLRGACGKSLVLFASIDRTAPVYQKFCKFQPAVVQSTVFMTPEVVHGEIEEQQEQQLPIPTTPFPVVMEQQQQQLDIYALHGIHRPEERCSRCSEEFRQHQHQRECDQNGWVRVQSRLLDLPADWPTYNPSTHTWICR